MSTNLPTRKLELTWPKGAEETAEARDAFNEKCNQEIVNFASMLRELGERPWFEIWYKGFPDRPDTTAADFDAVEVAADGTITTLPPYAELEAQS